MLEGRPGLVDGRVGDERQDDEDRRSPEERHPLEDDVHARTRGSASGELRRAACLFGVHDLLRAVVAREVVADLPGLTRSM